MSKDKKIKINKIHISAAVLSLIITTAIIAGTSYADTSDMMFGKGRSSGMRKMATHFPGGMRNNDAAEIAVNANDYGAWVKAVGENSDIAKIIKQENFPKFIEAHNLISEGRQKMEQADKILSDLGVKQQNGKRGDRGMGMMGEFDRTAWQDARKAIIAGDYQAWLKAVKEDSEIAKAINTEDKFLKLVESHNLMQKGDFDSAQKIREDLGLKTGKGERSKMMIETNE